MIDIQTLFLFSAAVLALLVSPGPNMAFLLSHGISDGPRGGLAVAFGITAADLVLTVLTATGVTALVAAWPPSFDLLRYVGALYLVWLAIQALRRRSAATLMQKRASPTGPIFRAAMLNSLLNPKALLFFLVFLPQFVDPAKGSISLQLALLGGLLSAIALVFHSILGVLAGRLVMLFMRSSMTSVRYFGWLHVGLFVALAARLLWLDRPLTK
jgi:threonine/homoserine/homoserine lactone efflux protein